MHPDLDQILLPTETIANRIEQLGREITAATTHIDQLVLVGVLKGSVMFMSDLARALDRSIAIDFIAVSSYGASTASSGVVRLVKDLDLDIGGKHVMLVEDIVDSGLTLSYVMDMFRRRNPASLTVCALLNKPERRSPDVELTLDYVGFDIPNAFVVGYGLDYAERYRNLPYIGVLSERVYAC